MKRPWGNTGEDQENMPFVIFVVLKISVIFVKVKISILKTAKYN